jgi:predicted MFS family arabinose efflux permease
VYARIFVLGGAGCALLMLVMPHAIGPWGTAGAFGALLVASLVSSPLLVFMPAHPPPSEDPVKPGLPRGPAVAAALLASLVVTVGLDALWAFAERIGRRAGLEPTALGLVLGMASLAVLVAAGLASWLGLRLGRVAPLVLGFGVLAGSAVVLGHARTPGVYVTAVLLLGPGFFFSQPFMMGAMAALDPYGRVGAAAGGAMTVGAALGPGVGGLLVAAGDYAALGWLGAACGLVSLALIGPVALRVDRVTRGAPPSERSIP